MVKKGREIRSEIKEEQHKNEWKRTGDKNMEESLEICDLKVSAFEKRPGYIQYWARTRARDSERVLRIVCIHRVNEIWLCASVSEPYTVCRFIFIEWVCGAREWMSEKSGTIRILSTQEMFVAHTVAYLSINHLSIHFVVICRLGTRSLW